MKLGEKKITLTARFGSTYSAGPGAVEFSGLERTFIAYKVSHFSKCKTENNEKWIIDDLLDED